MRGYGYTYVDKKRLSRDDFRATLLAIAVCSSQVETGRKTYCMICKLIDKKRNFVEKTRRTSKKDFCFHVYYSPHAAIHYKPLP
jgi:hypothetical protein